METVQILIETMPISKRPPQYFQIASEASRTKPPRATLDVIETKPIGKWQTLFPNRQRSLTNKTTPRNAELDRNRAHWQEANSISKSPAKPYEQTSHYASRTILASTMNIGRRRRFMITILQIAQLSFIPRLTTELTGPPPFRKGSIWKRRWLRSNGRLGTY